MGDQTNLQRIFLGLEQPPLLTAAAWLAEQFVGTSAVGATLDLANFLVVLPTARSRDRLKQLLVQAAQQRSLIYQPPRLLTIGQLPEHLYVAEKPLASELTQHIAWVRAIEAIPTGELQPLLGDREVDEGQDWQSLATVIAKLHIRLANDIWSFNSVWREVTADKKFLAGEAKRWEVLKQIQKLYYETLGSVDLWDKYGARNYAAAGLEKANEIRCASDREIVLVGCADLNRSTSEMLRQVAAAERSGTDRPQVTALIAADESMADRFDGSGSLVTQQWLEATLPLDDSQIRIVDRPSDQAYAIAHYLGELGTDNQQSYAADQITIGLPDETLAPLVERDLRSIGLSARRLAGVPLARTAPVRLLLACGNYLADQSFDSLAGLLRHPDLFDWVSIQLDDQTWLHDLDVFQNMKLPDLIRLDATDPFGNPDEIRTHFDVKDPKSKPRAARNAETATQLNQIHEALVRLLRPVAAPPQPIAEWAAAWRDVLLEVYGQQTFDDSREQDTNTLAACEGILDALSLQDEVPESFGLSTTAVQALSWVLDTAGGQRIVAPPQDDAVELAGWLDLPLDDSPVMVIASFNESHVPASEVGHQFLPNALCEQLRVLDNDRRYARDAYAVMVVASVRKKLLLISGRRNEQGEPGRPSRLLFADAPKVAALRARAFFNYAGQAETREWLNPDSKLPVDQQFTIPDPVVHKAPDNLTVTSFRDYLKCPYRFYLNKILRLETVADDWRELSGGTFGDLCHNVLEAFANLPVKDSTDGDEIYEFLSQELDRQATRDGTGYRLPAVRIQIEQLRKRFEVYAPIQAAHRASGWQIVSTEELLNHPMDVDGKPFTIRGKIDRVDQHETTGQVAVWDYKSSEKGAKPGQTHYSPRKQEWKDLQLPLYRHLVREVKEVAGADFDNLITGYILLHGKQEEIGFHAADWSPELLETAEETFRNVVRSLRKSEFWPPADPPPMFSEDLAGICLDGVFEQFTPESEVAQ